MSAAIKLESAMDKHLHKIIEAFIHDIELFKDYQNDIHERINKLNKELEELNEYIKNGGSISVESKVIVSEDGKQSRTMGIVDTPQVRETVAFRLKNKLIETKKYIELSLVMSFTYLMSIFDAKYIDVIKLYYENISDTFPSGVTVVGKLSKFAYKSFRKQITSLQQNAHIDFEKILGKPDIKKLIEIRETRNIIIHNSGIVNQKYLSNVINPSFKEGDYRTIDQKYLKDATDLLQIFFNELTNQIQPKLS